MPAIRGTRRTLLSGNETGALLTQQRTNGSLLIYDMQEPSGDVSIAWNKAVALGRDLVINGDFANWTGTPPNDSPDGWVAQQAGDATSNVTQNPAGECQIISDGTNTAVAQVILTIGKRYIATMDVNAITGSIKWGDSIGGAGQEIIASTGAKSFSFVAGGTTFAIRRNAPCDATIDNVTVKQTNIAASSEFPGAEELDESGQGTADKDNWAAVNNATLTNPSTNLLRVARSTTSNPQAAQAILTTDKRYRLVGEARSDGNATPTANDSTTIIWTGTTSTDWQPFDFEFTATNDTFRVRSTTSTGTQFTEWRNLSVRLANPLNGDDTGTTPGVAGNGRIRYMKSYDGATSFTDIYSAELNSIFDPTKGTLMIAARVANAGVWIDSSVRYMVHLHADTNNFIDARRGTANGTVLLRYKSGGAAKQVTITGLSTLDIFTVAITWDKSADAVIAYINGAKTGLTLSGLGTWVGNLLSTTCVIGAATTIPASIWHGDLSYTQLYSRALTQPEIAAISRSLGVF